MKGAKRMAVNAQSILETIQRNAQKKIPTNKIKKAAVPDLSMYLWEQQRWELPRREWQHRPLTPRP